ncbi:four helix bundle protein [Halocola ammonii]
MTTNKFEGGFRELEAWKKARLLRREISELSRTFPDSEKFRLSSQLLRASRGITACIAEGYGRFHFQENIQFCRTARGSLMECLDHLTCALDEGYIDDEKFRQFEGLHNEVLKILNGYISYLKRRKRVLLNSYWYFFFKTELLNHLIYPNYPSYLNPLEA